MCIANINLFWDEQLYFRDRFANFEVAAAGFLVCARGAVLMATEHGRLVSLLSHAEMRMYGALRFDDGELRGEEPAISGPWASYEGYVFVLPAVELIRDVSGETHLAVNMTSVADAPQILDVLRKLCPAPRVLHTVPAAFMMPCARRMENTVDFSAWDARMGAILRALRGEEYQKLVLARGKRFTFDSSTRQDPMQILAALDESNSRRAGPAGASRGAVAGKSSSYLFCLQLDDQHAFLGCTPERLFHLRGNEVLTNAIAGTVRRDSENEEALLRELWGRKNVSEHNFVVDHIRTALDGLGAEVVTSPTKVLPLPRLMHLSTTIVGALGDSADVESSTANTVFRLLKTMHPTPAVCGMPRKRTLHELAKIERFDRGLFAGPFGWFSRNEGEFCVAIRSAIVSENTVTAFAGSGIVQGSESRSEWDETELKMSAFTDLFMGGRGLKRGLKTGFSTRRTENGKEVRTPLANGVSGHRPGGQPPGASHTPFPNGKHVEGSELQAFDSSKIELESNLNALWGGTAVEELCRNGIGTFFIAPGSRSAPLAVAVVRSPHAQLFVVHDERSAGFLALGFARATGRAAAVVTSSGTAVANLLPAVVEAHMDNIPMLLLTADRPPELRDTGANQTIDQVNIFGSYVRWFADVPCPTQEIPLRKLLSDVDHAVHMSGSLPLFDLAAEASTQECGPVHLNFMFREHLAPKPEQWDRSCVVSVPEQWKQSVRPLTVYTRDLRGGPTLVDSVLRTQSLSPVNTDCETAGPVFRHLTKRAFGLIVAGGGPGAPLCEEDKLYIYMLAEELGWPVLADVGSGVRFDDECSSLVSFADQMLVSEGAQALFEAQTIVQFGERLVSKRIAQMISRAGQSSAFVHILVSPRLKRSNQVLTVTHRVQSTSASFIKAWYSTRGFSWDRSMSQRNEQLSCDSPARLSCALDVSSGVNTAIKKMMITDRDGEISEPWFARTIIESIKYPCALYIGNSMPIRDIDMYANCTEHSSKLRIGTNRGASGIDGIVSSGMGFGLGLSLPSVIVLGDMSLLHDISALHFLRPDAGGQSYNGEPVTIVVVNNGGGAIFSMLPIASYASVFSPVFDTPHCVGFRSLAELFQMEHILAKTVGDVENVLFTPAQRHRLVEICVSGNHKENAELHKKIADEISRVVTFQMEGGPS